ncbi:MAG: tetratricopeptide repeat protein [Alphaproteobacteria bacterium]|nr:tetratricopeptide repeat protein [Alphaproteobacteria bacterium]
MSEPARLRSSAPAVEVKLPLTQVLKIAQEYVNSGRIQDAQELLRAAIRAAPRDPEALHQAGIVAFQKGELEHAAELIELAIAVRPDASLYLRNICSIYERLGRYDEAVAAGARAVQLDPLDSNAMHNLSVVHQRLLRLDEALGYARRAITLDPASASPHLALAELLLLRGEMAEGLAEYEWRFRVPEARRHLPDIDRPQWDGAPLPEGSLLLIADQGFGDVLQFLRYLPWVAERCPRLVLACGPELRRLVEHNYPDLPVFDRWDARPSFAAFCPLSGLPRLHATRLATIPAKIPYIAAEPIKASAWSARLQTMLPHGYRRVGIVWSGREHPPNRSISLASLAPIAALEDICLVSLQMARAQDEVAGYFGCAPLLALGHEIADFTDTAAILANLDLVVTIDTAVAHLAGAMGKPAWIMLPYSPDWRWLLEREDSPWYPTARLFRQPAPGQWEPVVACIATALSAGQAMRAT